MIRFFFYDRSSNTHTKNLYSFPILYEYVRFIFPSTSEEDILHKSWFSDSEINLFHHVRRYSKILRCTCTSSCWLFQLTNTELRCSYDMITVIHIMRRKKKGECNWHWKSTSICSRLLKYNHVYLHILPIKWLNLNYSIFNKHYIY